MVECSLTTLERLTSCWRMRARQRLPLAAERCACESVDGRKLHNQRGLFVHEVKKEYSQPLDALRRTRSRTDPISHSSSGVQEKQGIAARGLTRVNYGYCILHSHPGFSAQKQCTYRLDAAKNCVVHPGYSWQSVREFGCRP